MTPASIWISTLGKASFSSITVHQQLKCNTGYFYLTSLVL